MGRLFGTDGVRGVANTELTAEIAFKLGRAGAYVLTNETHHKPKILIGKDTRVSGDMLESALIAGICSVGAHAVSVGVIPTPAVAYLTRLYNADAGVVISASHNPAKYNGIKFFNNKGYKLNDQIEERIEAIIFDDIEQMPRPIGNNLGYRIEEKNAVNDYVRFSKSTIDCDLKGLKIVIDCANGAAHKTAPLALSQLDANILTINNEPNGTNINLNCGSTHMENLQQFVKESKADIGLAFDGDADRLLAVDEKGNIVNGDEIMAICSLDLMQKGKLNKNTLVVTVMSNLGLSLMAKENRMNISQTKVGDRYVLEEMLKYGYVIGGEQSGHIIFLDYNTTGDGLITALQLLSILKKSGKKLSQLASVMNILPQVLINAKVSNKNKHKYMNDKVIVSAVHEVEDEFKNTGRVLIRPSGTEPLIRVMIEGQDKDLMQSKAQNLALLIEKRLGK